MNAGLQGSGPDVYGFEEIIHLNGVVAHSYHCKGEATDLLTCDILKLSNGLI